MTRRDLAFTLVGLLLVVCGILFAAQNYTNMAIICLLVFGFIVLLVIILQRRQLGILQKRTLDILRNENIETIEQEVESAPPSKRELEVAVQISTKKIIGLLHAQQLQIEELSKRLSKTGSLPEDAED